MAKRTPRGEKVEYTLLENGLDFVQHGLDKIANGSEPSELKYAVLHLGGGIELVLKERLRREDWRQIFSNPLHADKKKYSTGNFSSVNLHQCLDRLEQFGVKISADARRKIKSFYDRRNRIQHFRFGDTREAIESAAAEVVSVLLDLIGDEFDLGSLEPAEHVLLADIRGRVADFRQFTESRMKEIEPKLILLKGKHGSIIQCPTCLQQTLSADCEVQCPFCGYRDVAWSAADVYISNIVGYKGYDPKEDEGEYPRYYCPECDNEALVANEDGSFICFACGYYAQAGELRICGWCGNPKDAEGFCGDRCMGCDSAYLAQDNT